MANNELLTQETLIQKEVSSWRTTSEIRHLIHFWTIELASLDQTKHLTNLRKSRAYFGGCKRKDSIKGWEGSPMVTCTTAMKTPERGGLQGTDRAVTTCHLPQRYRGVEHTFLLTLSSDTTSALGVRISLEAFERNLPQPRELTWAL